MSDPQMIGRREFLIAIAAGTFVAAKYEAASAGGVDAISGVVVLVGDVVNANRRVYPAAVLEAEAERLEKAARSGDLIYGHAIDGPPYTAIDYQDGSAFSKAAIMWTRWEYHPHLNFLLADGIILKTNAGRALAEALRVSPSNFHVMASGVGALIPRESDGAEVVQIGYQLKSVGLFPAPVDPAAGVSFLEARLGRGNLT